MADPALPRHVFPLIQQTKHNALPNGRPAQDLRGFKMRRGPEYTLRHLGASSPSLNPNQHGMMPIFFSWVLNHLGISPGGEYSSRCLGIRLASIVLPMTKHTDTRQKYPTPLEIDGCRALSGCP